MQMRWPGRMRSRTQGAEKSRSSWAVICSSLSSLVAGKILPDPDKAGQFHSFYQMGDAGHDWLLLFSGGR